MTEREPRFRAQHVYTALERDHFNGDLLAWTMRKLIEQLWDHPEYPAMRDSVLGKGHRLVNTFELDDSSGELRVSVHAYDGGPPADPI